MRHARLENMLKVLEVEGVVERNRGKWRRTPTEWEYPQARVDAVTAARRAEQERMREYLAGSGCLMEFLQRELNDPDGRAVRPVCVVRRSSPRCRSTIDRELAREAVAFLRGRRLSLEPRKQWADGKKIPADRAGRAGRVLSHYADGGWGTLVKEQREAGAYSDELAWALAELDREAAVRARRRVGDLRSVVARRPSWLRAWPARSPAGLAAAVRAGGREGAGDRTAEGDGQQRAAVRERRRRVRDRRAGPVRGRCC